jgi:hypothetical protein
MLLLKGVPMGFGNQAFVHLGIGIGQVYYWPFFRNIISSRSMDLLDYLKN